LSVSAEFILGVGIAMIGALISAVVWAGRLYIREAFKRNDDEHESIKTTVGGVARRVDHIIRHHEGMPPYREEP